MVMAHGQHNGHGCGSPRQSWLMVNMMVMAEGKHDSHGSRSKLWSWLMVNTMVIAEGHHHGHGHGKQHLGDIRNASYL